MSENCIRCKSRRLARIVAKCSDMFSMGYMGKSYHGEVPSSEIGSGDYIEFEYCLGCGQIQGVFPEDEPEKDVDEQPSFFQRLDIKKAAMITFVFILLANPWSDSIISKMPYMDNGLVSFGFKGLIFFVIMMMMNAMM